MTKDPAFLFYSNDFDSGTKFFSHEQVGMYVRLLIAQHQHGHLTEKQVAIIVSGEPDNEVMKKFSIDEEGKYFHPKLDEVVLKRKKHKTKQIENINKRWNIPNRYQTDTKPNTKTIPLENENEIENENENENENERENEDENEDVKKKSEIILPFDTEAFQAWWKTWLEYRKEIKKPYKSPKSAQCALKLLSGFDSITACKMIEQSIANGWQGLFEIKNNGNKQSVTEKNADQLRRVMEGKL